VATGQLIRDLTTGTRDGTPQFSPDGGFIVFDHNGRIVTLNPATGAQRVVGQGEYPFWGAAGGPAPAISLSLVPGRGLQWAALHRQLSVFCRLTGAGRCAVTASISPFTARRLHLSVKAGAGA
jgi:hypothetical protein